MSNFNMAEAPDYAERVFYVSGPNAMGIAKSQIKTDFFPGFA